MYNLHQAPRLQKKENFNPWIDRPLLSNALLFLYFQTVQKRHKGAIHHAFFLFLPTKKPCHRNKASLTKEWSTHDTPKRENRRYYKTLILLQWRRMWSTDSSSLRHGKHLFAKDHSLLWMWFKVRTFLQVASQTNKTILSDTHGFQITLVGKTPCLTSSNTLYKVLTEKASFLDVVHKISSSLSLDTILPCNLKRMHSMVSIS